MTELTDPYWRSDDGLAELWQADARQLDMLDDDSVDLIVTSPPYWALRSYQDDGEHYDGQIGSEATPAEFVANLVDCTREWARVLKPTGSMFLNLGDKMAGSGGHNNASVASTGIGDNQTAARRNGPNAYLKGTGAARAKSLLGLPWRYANACVDELDLILRAEIVWEKPNGLPESVTDRVRRSHEQWFHMTVEPRYFSAIDELRQPYSPETAERYAYGFGNNYAAGSGTKNGPLRADGGGPDATNPLGRLPGSVWSIPSEPLLVPDEVREHYDLPDHFAAFPQEWPRRFVLGWSTQGWCQECGEPRRPDIILDRQPTQAVHNGHGFMSPGHGGRDSLPHRTAATIVGYRCECPDADAPTTPATVLDPFAGTGTTVGVARALGRKGIGVDLSGDYLKLARWRVADSGHFDKTRQRTHADRQGTLL